MSTACVATTVPWASSNSTCITNGFEAALPRFVATPVSVAPALSATRLGMEMSTESVSARVE